MIDRTDLQLMITEQIMGMGADGLMELFSQLTGHDPEMYDETTDTIIGSVETIDIEDSQGLKKWLGFLLYALGERFGSVATEAVGNRSEVTSPLFGHEPPPELPSLESGSRRNWLRPSMR